jgi:hypothetical protein
MNPTLRKSLLISLLNLSSDFRELEQELQKFKWDSEELVILKRTQLRNLFDKYLVGEFSVEDISEWANIIESRDDIGYESPYEYTIKQIIFELANPEINENLSIEKSNQYLKLLS